MKQRFATEQEIKDNYKFEIKHGYRIRFRHPVFETACRSARYGVRYKQNGNSKLSSDLTVTFQGRQEKIKAYADKDENGTIIVHNLFIGHDSMDW